MISPNDPELAQAVMAAQRQDFARAVDILARLLARDPSDAALWFNRAVMLQQLARHGEAIDDYDKALALRGEDVDAWFNRAIACEAAERYEDAVRSYNHALRLQASHGGARTNLGALLARLGRHAEALASFESALRLNPRDVKALYNSGNALRALDQPQQALIYYDRVLTIEPNHADAWNNRGVALEMLERTDEAIASYDEALRRGGATSTRLINRANALMEQNRLEEALTDCDAALSLPQEKESAAFTKSIALLTLGRFDEGWPLYEERWRGADPRADDVTAPLWRGERDISGKRILLQGEQGLGDMIQFARFAAPIAARGARATMRVQPALKTLFRESLGASVEDVLSYDDPAPETDFCAPLMSLALACGTRLETIPSAPYLEAAPARVAAWRAKLPYTDLPRVGIVWRGDCGTRHRARRSMALETFGALFGARARFVGLQLELADAEEADSLRGAGVAHFGDDLRDFSETAALIACCDLVITIDTSVAHLAGALGKPVWVLLRHWGDWRWLLTREDSPWYPNARLFRQRAPGDWDELIARVRSALEDWLSARG